MAIFCLGEAAFGTLFSFLDSGGSTTNLLIGVLEQLSEREFHVLGDDLHLGQSLASGFFKEGGQSVFLQPVGGLRSSGNGR